MPKKVLITAFEPFGLVGKFARQSNASEVVLERLREDNGDEYLYLTLPVGEDALAMLDDVLEREKPSAVVSMGEHLFVKPGSVCVERYAHDVKPSPFPDLSLQFREKSHSGFSEFLTEGQGPSHIGNYYCNAVYQKALRWSEQNGDAPVTFLHVPVLGDVEDSVAAVRRVISSVDDYTQTQKNSADKAGIVMQT